MNSPSLDPTRQGQKRGFRDPIGLEENVGYKMKKTESDDNPLAQTGPSRPHLVLAMIIGRR